jgi:5'-nucleotidase
MRILVTNDDGINAPGLKVAEAIAHELAGPDGQVFTVAPAMERSGVGHCISYTNPMLITQINDTRFAVEGNPADCVLAGIYHVMADARPDLIISGVNRGNNSGENVLYSGTLGAAMEGALQGIFSIALSQYYGPNNVDLADPFDASAKHGVSIIHKIMASNVPDDGEYKLFYNVNFPPVASGKVSGVRVVRQGRRVGTNFSVTPHAAKSGREFLFIHGGNQHVPTAPDTDVQANMDGYISITPLRADLTAHDTLTGFKDF